MAVQPVSEPIVVTPLSDGSGDGCLELEVERKRRRAEARRARQGTAFDGLAIGAPLSAAFIGMLFADGHVAADAGPGRATDDVVGARDSAVDTIFDHEGANTIEIENARGHTIETAVLGQFYKWTINKKIGSPLLILSIFTALAGFEGEARAASIGDMVGGGNFVNLSIPSEQYALLDDLNATWGRFNFYPNYYWKSGEPTPARWDAPILAALQNDINVHAHFEFYHEYTFPPRTYEAWYAIGREFAKRFQPNSTFLTGMGIQDKGIESWAAINEPDGHRTGGITPEDYYNMLKGLAEGIHSQDPDARVYPGGYLSANRDNEFTAWGRLPKIAPLLNNGTLAGFDIHTYHDKLYAPIHNRYNDTTQHDFDKMKETSGITRNVELLVSEHNYKNSDSGQGYDANWAKRYFLPHFWDQIGVVGNDGNPITRFALTWNLFRQGPTWGYSTNSVDPIAYNETGVVYKMVLDLIHDMSLVKADPKDRGEYILEGGGKKMWVFQNVHSSWSNIYGGTYTVTNIPDGVTELEIWRYNGLSRKVSTNGKDTLQISTPTGEVYMILARNVSGTGGTGTTPSPCNLLDSSVDTPSGWGASYNIFSATKEILIKTTCDGTNVTVDIGNGQSTTYIYQTGYEWKNNSWISLTMSGATPAGAWFTGSASKTLTRTSTELSSPNYVVAYICQWQNSSWKCGCQNAACATPAWNLQVFKK